MVRLLGGRGCRDLKMMASQLFIQVKRQPARYLLVISLSMIMVLPVLLNLGRVSSRLERLVPPYIGGERSTTHSSSNDIYNTTLGFEKIYVVSLPERTDHRDGLTLASAICDIKLEYVDGIRGDNVPDKTLPAKWNKDLQPSNIGAWRAHMNAMSAIIRQNISSALVLEDDVDWDVRFKQSLDDFALSANTLLQSSSTTDINFENLPLTALPQFSPYGDGWDVLWLGHCGMHLPPGGGVVVHKNDATVPEERHLKSHITYEITPLSKYPEHTRTVVKDVNEGTCSLAYAVTQSAARQILYHLGLERLDESFDLALRGWCEGSKTGIRRVCLSVVPQLFDHHRRAGPLDIDSDISTAKDGFRETAFTNNIRWSVMMNLKRLVNGDTDYDDQYPDA